MKILVTGVNGQVGWELARSLMPIGEVVAMDRAGFDLSAPEVLEARLNQIQPDIIVNAAAYTAVDKAESEEALATVVNGASVGVLALWAKNNHALLIHYSTDYVFDGTKTSPYVESDTVCPINAYGRSKLAGEQAIQKVGGDYLIFRTSWVYAARGQNFVRTMLRLGQERETLGVVNDQVGAPTWARNIADVTAFVLVKALEERQKGEFTSGVFNLGAKGEVSWHGFAERIFSIAKGLLPNGQLKIAQLNAIPTSAYPLPAKRPSYSRLDCSAIEARFGVAIPHWELALPLCINDTV
ncbi:MAG: dTDP-4-dehydrorhamnose reductase [Hahellaceae bacterium]|nr:dTDP-4-dehydrorhamnose reductase [Hahellaceae bacterium]